MTHSFHPSLVIYKRNDLQWPWKEAGFHGKTASESFNLIYSIHSFKVLLLWMLFIMAFGTTFYMVMDDVSFLTTD